MRKDDPLSLVQYAHDNNLTKTNGWKLAKKDKRLIKKYVKLINRVDALQAHKDKARNKSSLGSTFLTIPGMLTFWTS